MDKYLKRSAKSQPDDDSSLMEPSMSFATYEPRKAYLRQARITDLKQVRDSASGSVSESSREFADFCFRNEILQAPTLFGTRTEVVEKGCANMHLRYLRDVSMCFLFLLVLHDAL